MDQIQNILGVVMLIDSVIVIAYALAASNPKLLTSVGWHVLCSVGWVN